MRHRAHRSVLDRLRPLARTRGAPATAALLLAGLVTVTALTAGGPTGDTPAAGPAQSTDLDAAADPPAPTLTGSTGPERNEQPSAELSPSSSPTLRSTPRPTQTTASRSGGRGADEPTPQEKPRRSTPTATPTEAPSAQEPAADLPQTTATTRSANASRWVIGISSDTEATYECSLDGGAYQPCGSTVTYDGLEKGTHSFAARATDDEGDTDPSPATLSAEIGPRGQG